MNDDRIEAEPIVSTAEIKEAIKENLGAVPVEKKPPAKLRRDDVGGVTSRTLAYTLAMILVVFWLATLNIAFFSRIQMKNRSEGGQHTWFYINEMLKDLIIYLSVPLFVILPPFCERKLLRLCVCLGLSGVGLLLLLAQVVSGAVWAILSPRETVLARLPVLLLQWVLCLLLSSCLLITASLRLSAWRGGQSGNTAVGKAMAANHTCHLLLVFCTAVLAMGGFGLQDCAMDNITTPEKNDCEGEVKLCRHYCRVLSSGSAAAALLPMVQFTLLLVIQLRHYSRSHVGFFTRQRAAEHTRRFISDFPLSPLERNLLHEKAVETRLIHATFTVPMYSCTVCRCA